ncbi:hypothetical protein JD844_015376 [Phrynosoma platyrhinos]|uniref:Uncharacterized protein n=1 Tax=Phrynosoma platyrhinos TaxID=52577 RepID=A0ABQ7SJB1_PHRPL|nr:hypothetical protein JD844_015376 [Phrynosoma platyrhinos]
MERGGDGGPLGRPLLSTLALEEQEGESDDLTDSEESVFSGLEDSGSDSLTEAEEEDDRGSGAEENPDDPLSSENTHAEETSKKKVLLGRKVKGAETSQQEKPLENEYAEDSSDEEQRPFQAHFPPSFVVQLNDRLTEEEEEEEEKAWQD